MGDLKAMVLLDSSAAYSFVVRLIAVDVKKAIDDTLDFLEVIIKGPFLSVACGIFGITSLTSNIILLLSGMFKMDTSQQLQDIHHVATN